MKTSEMLTAEIHLPYYKQGDDLSYFLDQESHPPAKAMVLHAAMLEAAGKQLRDIAALVGDTPVEVQAGTHFISIHGPASLISALIKDELATKMEWADEDDDEDECDDDSCDEDECDDDLCDE